MTCQEYRSETSRETERERERFRVSSEMNRDVIADDGINYRRGGEKRNTLDYSRACFFPPLVEKRRTRIDGAVVRWPGRKVDNHVALIPMDEIDRPVSPGPDLRIHCFPSHFVSLDLARRISRRRCVNYSLRIRPVGVKLANNFTSP